MIQKISVRIVLKFRDKSLVLRRSDGRESLIGTFELPGGKVFKNEQPEDAAHRYLKDDVGLAGDVHLDLIDAFTYHDKDQRDFQYAVIVYAATLVDKNRSIHLSEHYDKYIWYSLEKGTLEKLSDVSKIILEVPSFSVAEGTESDTKSAGEDDMIFVYTDGGSRGNPGPSAAGYVIIKDGSIIDQGSEYLGITTNNLAEYQGVVIGLEAAQRLSLRRFTMRIDSMLVVNQLNGAYTIKNRELWPISERIKGLIATFDRVKFVHIPRELNQLADGMVNKALDSHEQRGVEAQRERNDML